MKTAICVCVIVLISFLGCSRNAGQRTISQPHAEPGRGISGECEIGMRFDEISKLRPGFLIETQFFTRALAGAFPSQGITVHASRSNGLITHIDFSVDPDFRSNRFYGTVDGLEFSPRRVISRSDIIKRFGSVPIFQDTNVMEGRPRLEAGQDLGMTNSGKEILYYVSKGIMFELEQGIVTRFSVIPIFKTNGVGQSNK